MARRPGSKDSLYHNRAAVSLIVNQERMQLRSSTYRIKSSQFICPALEGNQALLFCLRYVLVLWTLVTFVEVFFFSNQVSGNEDNKHYQFLSSVEPESI